MSDFLSHDNPIPEKKYADIPFGTSPWTKRNVAREEVCRDLDKSPDQLLIDIHDESLDRNRRPSETISRTLARMASMELRIQKELERQAKATEALNCRITFFGMLIGGLSLFFGIIQAVTGVLALCKG